MKWTSVSDRPPRERLVLGWLEGWEYHADARWRRSGYALVVHWGSDVEHTDAQGFSVESVRRAAQRLIDPELTNPWQLEVTHWAELPLAPGHGA